MLPLISVIVPVLDGRATMPKLLDELLRQNYPPDRFEILVVDGGSSDGTADLVRRRFANKYSCIRVLDNPLGRSSAGRNIGIRAARGQVLVFIDGHCSIPSRNLLEDTAAILSLTGAGCLCRPQPLLAPSDTPTGEVIALARTSWLGRGGNSAAGNRQAFAFADPVHGGSTYRREVFDRIGFFDETFDACADIEFNLRVRKAGIRAYADPRLAVHARPPATLRALLSQGIAKGRDRMRLMRKHPAASRLSELIPLAILVALLVAPLAWLLLPRMAALLAAAPLALIAGAVAFASLQLGIRHGLGTLWKAPWVFAAMGCGTGTGLILEALLPAKSAVSAPAPIAISQPLHELEPLQQTDRAA
jgi:succinoglycan biosynthesis protein ExoA